MSPNEGYLPELQLPKESQLKIHARQLWQLDKTLTTLSNLTQAEITENFIRKSKLYPQIVSLRRDKNADREETQKIIKKALKELNITSNNIIKLRNNCLKKDEPYCLVKKAKKFIQKQLKNILEKKPIYINWLEPLRGMSVLLSAKLLAIIGDIGRFKTPSSLWHYAGLHVVDGKAPKPKRGQESTWNPRLKSLCYLIAKNQIMQRGPFRQYYDEYKHKDAEKHPDYKKFYLNNRAIRYCAKMFLLEFWVASYQALDLEPPTKPYVLTLPNHHEDPLKFPYPSQVFTETYNDIASHEFVENQKENASQKGSGIPLKTAKEVR